MAMIGSLLAHAALLIASSRIAGVAAAVPAEPPRPHHGTGAFVLHPMPIHWQCMWPPSPALQACFSEAVLDPGAPGASAAEPTVEGFGYKAYASQSWVRLGAPEGPGPEEKDLRATLFREGLRECAGVARGAGWSGDGRVFVRVTREGEDRTLVQALPLDDESNDPGLLCCLRESQEMLAQGMKPGHTVRYTFQQGEEDIEMKPPPM